MVTNADAIVAIEGAIAHLFEDDTDVRMADVAAIVVGRLEAHGITPRTIKAAFNTPKRNEGEEN